MEDDGRGWDGLLEVWQSSGRHPEGWGYAEHGSGGRPSPEKMTAAAAVLACCGGAGELEGDSAEVLEARAARGDG